jgi:hypothetical protein
VSYIDGSRGTDPRQMFVIAGPVIVYGTVGSVVYGLVYWLYQALSINFLYMKKVSTDSVETFLNGVC